MPEGVYHCQGMDTNQEPRRDDRLLSPQELSELVGVPVGTVYQWNYRKVGPRAIKVGKHVRYRMSDVNAWLEGNTVEAAG